MLGERLHHALHRISRVVRPVHRAKVHPFRSNARQHSSAVARTAANIRTHARIKILDVGERRRLSRAVGDARPQALRQRDRAREPSLVFDAVRKTRKSNHRRARDELKPPIQRPSRGGARRVHPAQALAREARSRRPRRVPQRRARHPQAIYRAVHDVRRVPVPLARLSRALNSIVRLRQDASVRVVLAARSLAVSHRVEHRAIPPLARVRPRPIQHFLLARSRAVRVHQQRPRASASRASRERVRRRARVDAARGHRPSFDLDRRAVRAGDDGRRRERVLVALDPEPRVERAVARRPARRRASHVESVPRGRRARDGAIARFDGAVRRAATRVASRTGVAGAPASVRDARCRASRVG